MRSRGMKWRRRCGFHSSCPGCRVFCTRFAVFFAWQVNFTLTEHGHSSVPYWLAVLVTVLVSTVGVDAVLVRAEDPALCHCPALHCTARHSLTSRVHVATSGGHAHAPCGHRARAGSVCLAQAPPPRIVVIVVLRRCGFPSVHPSSPCSPENTWWRSRPGARVCGDGAWQVGKARAALIQGAQTRTPLRPCRCLLGAGWHQQTISGRSLWPLARACP